MAWSFSLMFLLKLLLHLNACSYSLRLRRRGKLLIVASYAVYIRGVLAFCSLSRSSSMETRGVLELLLVNAEDLKHAHHHPRRL